MRSVLDTVLMVLRRPLETAICFLLLSLTFVVFAQVVARYWFQAPLSWSEELARFLLMWLAMLSAAYAFKSRSHFALRLVVDKFPPRLRFVADMLAHGLVVVFLALLLYYSIVFLSGVSGHWAPALQIPMEIPYSSIAVGAALMLLESVKLAWRHARRVAAGDTSQSVQKRD